jgi:hypothetical protein
MEGGTKTETALSKLEHKVRGGTTPTITSDEDTMTKQTQTSIKRLGKQNVVRETETTRDRLRNTERQRKTKTVILPPSSLTGKQ